MATAIKVENLSKKYMIRHEKGKEYRTFRDDLVEVGEKIITRLMGPSIAACTEGKNLEEFWALNDLNFTIEQGDRVGIIGKNGAGKSTLLKVLSRITEPSHGTIRINGRIASLLEVGTGFHPELTGRENIFLNGAILGMSRQEIKRKFDEIVAFAEVEKFLDTPVKRYSSGMYVRLAFSVAAHLEPEILVVDEVLAVGDVEFQKKCLGKMGDVSKDGRTILFVSHNMNAIEQLCNKAILLEQGRMVQQSDKVRDLIHLYLSSTNDSKQHSASWSNLENEYKNRYFTPILFELQDSNGNQLSQAMKNNDVTYVVIEGSAEEMDVALQVGYALYDENNQLLYWSTFNDTAEEKWPKIDPGKNRLRAQIPTRLLNEGSYRVELLVALYFRSWVIEPQKNAPAIFFTIQGGLSDSPYWMIRRPGVMGPVIQWEKV